MIWQRNMVCTTIGGDEVLIYCVDAPGPYPIHGRFVYRPGEKGKLYCGGAPICWDKFGNWANNQQQVGHEFNLGRIVKTKFSE